LQFWKRALAKPNLLEVLQAADDPLVEPWPMVVSPACRAPLQDGQEPLQRGFRDLTLQFLEYLARDWRDIGALPEPHKHARIEALLKVRDLVGEQRGYLNLLLADTLNRVAVVLITGDVVDRRGVPQAVPALIEHLRRCQLDTDASISLAEAETGRALRAEVESEDDPRRRFSKLLELTQGSLEDAFFTPSAKPEVQDTFRLYDQPELGRLLARCWFTDKKVHVDLPLLVRHAGSAADFSSQDDVEKISATLNLTPEIRESYGSPLNRAQASAVSDVFDLLDAARRDRLARFCLLEVPPDSSDRKLTLNALSAGLELGGPTLRAWEPLAATLVIENRGDGAVDILDPTAGGTGSAEAPLVVDLQAEDGQRWTLAALHPPGARGAPPPAARRFPRITLAPGVPLRIVLCVAADWSGPQAELLLTEPRKYAVSARYFPLAVAEAGGERIDADAVVVTGALAVSVEPLAESDRACWQRIRSAAAWWALYDPAGRGLDQLDGPGLAQAARDFAGLSRDCAGGLFAPYLDYVRLLLKHKIGRPRLDTSDADGLRALAARPGFQYAGPARALLQELERSSTERTP
jgi:hypothetical protein